MINYTPLKYKTSAYEKTLKKMKNSHKNASDQDWYPALMNNLCN